MKTALLLACLFIGLAASAQRLPKPAYTLKRGPQTECTALYSVIITPTRGDTAFDYSSISFDILQATTTQKTVVILIFDDHMAYAMYSLHGQGNDLTPRDWGYIYRHIVGYYNGEAAADSRLAIY